MNRAPRFPTRLGAVLLLGCGLTACRTPLADFDSTKAASSPQAVQLHLVANEQPLEELPPPQAAEKELSRPPASLDPPPPPGPPRPLSLREVTESVYYAFPALEAAVQEAEITGGKARSAWGEFDLKLKAESVAQPEAYYKNYRSLVKLEQALWPGGNVFGQYRIGRGDFPIYFDDRHTNDGGEFKLGINTPLLRDRAIDQRRANIFQTTLQREQVDPYVQGRLLEYTLLAADVYWSWLAAGLGLQAQRELLRVTVERNKVYEQRVKNEDLAPIELVQNERLIAARESKLIEAERKLQQTSIKLSLFLRDEAGDPVLPPRALLPPAFPPLQEPDRDQLDTDIGRAIASRPELRELALQTEQANIDLAYGENLRLPMFNAVLEASKDVGGPADPKNTFGPFTLEAGLLFDVPLQRRKADGMIISAQGKIAQLAAKRRYAENKVAVDVQDALSGLITAYERVGRARQNTILAIKLEEAERRRFEAEDSDLLRVAIQESAAIEAQLQEIDTIADYFRARAAYRAALAIDPLSDDVLHEPEP